MPCVKVTAYLSIEVCGEINLDLRLMQQMIPFDPFQSGSLIRLSGDACYLSNSSEQDEQEEILEIAAIYEAICDPLPSPFFLPP